MNKGELIRKAWVKCAIRLPDPKKHKMVWIYIPEADNVISTPTKVFAAQQMQLEKFPELKNKVRSEPYWSGSGYLATHWMPNYTPED